VTAPQPFRNLALARARFTRGFVALRVRNYRLYWLGQLISNVGTWMQSTAQAWLVLQLTRSPFAIGLVTAFQFLPVMVLALVGGVVADRVPRHRLLVVTQSLALVLALAFGALVGTGLIQLWQVYIIALLSGIVTAIDAPVRQAFAVELVGPEDRANAVALNSMLFNGARIIGPALAGMLIGRLGIATIMYLNGASYLAVIAGLLLMDPRRFYTLGPRGGGSVLERLREGLRYITGTPEVLRVMLLIAAIGTFGYNFSVVLPLVGGFILHTDATEYGGLGTALGIGSLAGSLATAFARRVSVHRLLAAAGAFSVLLGAMALTTTYELALVVLIALGFAGVLFSTTANTLLQLEVPDALRGRVMSVYTLLFMGSTPVGGLLVGGAAHALGVANALVLCAALCLLGVGATLIYGRHAPAGVAPGISPVNPHDGNG